MGRWEVENVGNLEYRHSISYLENKICRLLFPWYLAFREFFHIPGQAFRMSVDLCIHKPGKNLTRFAFQRLLVEHQ